MVGGFCPGETIVIDLHIMNKTKKKIEAPIVSIIRQIRLNATYKSKTENSTIATIKMSKEVEAKTYVSFSEINLAIPLVCPSSLNYSRVIEVIYFLNVNINASGLVTAQGDIQMPIIIGTIPIVIDDPSNQEFTIKELKNEKETLKHEFEEPAGDIFSTNIATFNPSYPLFKNLINYFETKSKF